MLLPGPLALNRAYSQTKPTTSIHQAAVDGDVERVKALLDKGEDINQQNRMGWTALIAAVSHQRQPVIELLVSKGADVNVKDKQGRTALFLAVESKQKEVVELLVSKGADNVTTIRGENALTAAKKGGDPEMVDFLTKHGATEPVIEDMEGDLYGGPGRGAGRQMPERGVIRGRGAAAAVPGEVDVLADPNAIKAKIKAYKDMDKALATVAAKSQSEMRNWEQIRYDNRTTLARAVDKQIEDELGYVKKVAVEEKAKKTVTAIDELIKRRQERSKQVSKALLEQKREEREAGNATAGTRGRARVSTRGSRGGRYSQTGVGGADTGGDMYGGAGPYGGRETTPQRPQRPEEQLDAETEDAISLWTAATIDKKEDLAKSLNEGVKLEYVAVRKIAVEEKAEKTVAAIDGVLLGRQDRFNVYTAKMEQERLKLQERGLDPSSPDALNNTMRGRTRGRTSLRGNTGTQQQQNTSGRTRRRR